MTSYHFDGAVGESTTQQFSCEKLSVIRVRALIRNRQDLPASNLETVLSCGGVLKELNHKVTHWPVGIQVAVYPTSSDDSLYLDLPDFANDPVFLHLFSKPAFGLEVKMQLPDRTSVGMLRLVANTPSQQTLWIAPTYPSELLFDFVPK